MSNRNMTRKRGAVEPKAIRLSREELVRFEPLFPDNPLPLVARPVIEGVNLVEWAADNNGLIESGLATHGAILFRDFKMDAASDLEKFIKATSGELMEYRERSSPRHEVGEKIYTSTDYPAEYAIFPHNEHSYSLKFPLKLYFLCVTPALEGGQTPIADARKIYRRIDPEVRERFIQKKYSYVRNLGDGFGISWQTAFQTEDKAKAEKYCRDNAIEFEWKEGDRLRTRQRRPAVAKHPRTGSLVWFNHATFFHVSTLEPGVRDALLTSFEEDDLPNNTYYGDGSRIEPEVLDHLRAAYLEESVSFNWRERDVLLLDNMLTAHSRAPFVGPRTLLFGMGDPYTRDDI